LITTYDISQALESKTGTGTILLDVAKQESADGLPHASHILMKLQIWQPAAALKQNLIDTFVLSN
jgi:hypothetical protein